MGSVLIMLNFFVVKGKECTKLLYQFLQFVRNKRIEQNEEEQSNRQCTKNREIKLVIVYTINTMKSQDNKVVV